MKSEWDRFVASSQVDCFLFYRDFMDYHADRFTDHSLIFTEADKWIAVLPAHEADNEMLSHGGLTFGGLITAKKTPTGQTERMMDALEKYLFEKGFKSLYWKQILPFYCHNYRADIEYFLFNKGSNLVRRDLNYVIPLQNPLSFSKTKAQMSNRALPASLSIEELPCFNRFWEELLIPHLQKKYRAKPVHSVKEIEKLRKLFPNNIKLFVLSEADTLLAGVVLFENKKVVKSQYVAVNEQGRAKRALDYLYLYLIKKYKQDGFAYFDLGHVNIENGKKYNASLAKYKEELGAKPFLADHYSWKL